MQPLARLPKPFRSVLQTLSAKTQAMCDELEITLRGLLLKQSAIQHGPIAAKLSTKLDVSMSSARRCCNKKPQGATMYQNKAR